MALSFQKLSHTQEWAFNIKSSGVRVQYFFPDKLKIRYFHEA